MVGVLKLDVFKGGVGSENGLEDGRYLIYMFSRLEEVSQEEEGCGGRIVWGLEVLAER